jgi:hypothetical protein
LRLPDRPIADGRWHDCDGEGQYLLFPDLLIAIFCGAGNRVSAIVWQSDDRLLTHALQQRIADAIARRPMPRTAPDAPPAPEAHAAIGSNQFKQEAAEHPSTDGPSEPPSTEGPSTPTISAPKVAKEARVSKSTGGRHATALSVEPEALRMFAVRPGSAVGRAMYALAEWLAAGPVRTIVIKERAKQAGFSWATMRRAADALHVCIVRDGWGGAGAWWWSRGQWR